MMVRCQPSERVSCFRISCVLASVVADHHDAGVVDDGAEPGLGVGDDLVVEGAVLEPDHGKAGGVEVLEDGFEYEAQRFGSLSKVAKIISGQTVNGFIWWGLGGTGGKSRSSGGAGTRLQTKITKLEKLTARLRQALADGTLALADAEAQVKELTAKAAQSNTAPEIATEPTAPVGE